MMSVRSRVRHVFPLTLRWRLRQLRRAMRDVMVRRSFARKRPLAGTMPHIVCAYSLALRCYPGQEAALDAKRRNIELALVALDGVVARPGDTLSFWHAVGRPTRRAGYAEAATLRDGELTQEVGGAICFVSTLLYNAMLLSGMRIIERNCHSIDTYGDARYFELGRDASVEYAYRDLRARNAGISTMLLHARLEGDHASVAILSSQPLADNYEIEVLSSVVPAPREEDTLTVNTRRKCCGTVEDLGMSVYRAPATTVPDRRVL